MYAMIREQQKKTKLNYKSAWSSLLIWRLQWDTSPRGVFQNFPAEQRSEKAYSPLEKKNEFPNSEPSYKKSSVIDHPRRWEFYSITGDIKIKFSEAAALRMSLL